MLTLDHVSPSGTRRQVFHLPATVTAACSMRVLPGLPRRGIPDSVVLPPTENHRSVLLNNFAAQVERHALLSDKVARPRPDSQVAWAVDAEAGIR